jgi:hypothetical protein
MEYDRTDMVSLAVTAIAVVAFLLYVIFGPMNSPTGMADRIRIIKHEAVPQCGSFER